MKFVVEGNWRNLEKNLPRLRFVHHENLHGLSETETRKSSGGRRATNHLRHWANNNNAFDIVMFRICEM